MHLSRERDRLALARIELVKNKGARRSYDLNPSRRVNGPVPNCFRRDWMLEFRQHCRWNQNSCVELSEEFNLTNEYEVVERRGIGDDEYRIQC